METNMRDILHCDEQLRSTLYCDDKEKLRRKLALLQREYLRTAQRLQRAEQMDAVRRHVRSKITQHNQDQSDPAITSNPCLNAPLLTVNTIHGAEQDEGPEDSESSKRSQVIRFRLPLDAPCPQTPDASYDVANGHRPCSGMRLRSRRSRLRWERRSAEAGRITDTSEEGRGQSERIKCTEMDAEKEKMISGETEVVNESEELFSSSESPSLLLTHWDTHANTEAGDMEGMKTEEYQEQREKQSELSVEAEKQSTLLREGSKTVTLIKVGGQDCTQNGRIKESEAEEDGGISGGENKIRPCEENHKENTEQNKHEKIANGKTHINTMETKEDNQFEGDGKSVGVLDSCTLVEGLLYPAEYYVRTTRRMTFSQSQPDMQAVILSQLSTGRHRRSRGRKSVSNRNTQISEASGEQTKTEFASRTTTSTDPPKSHAQTADLPADLSQSSSEISDEISDSRSKINAFSSPTVYTSKRPGRGRKKRGRGRGRPSMPRSSLSLDTNLLGLGRISDSPLPTSTPVSPCLSPHSAASASCLTSQEAVPVTNNPLPATSHSTAPQLSSGINEAQPNAATGHLEKVYPIFLKSNVRNNQCAQMDRSTSSWQSLLLPSSPSAQTCLCQPLGLLVSDLMKFDIQQDFHLPDDQFASLKLHKLQQVAMESKVEGYTSPYNTRNRKRHSNSSCSGSSDPVTPLPLPLSLTPTITESHHFTGERRATTDVVALENLSVDRKLADQSLADVTLDSIETPGGQQTENLQSLTHGSSTKPVSLLEHFTADLVSQRKEHETVVLNSCNVSSVLTCNTDRPAGNVNITGHPDTPKVSQPALQKQSDCVGRVHSLGRQSCDTHQTEHKAMATILQETPEEASDNWTAGEICFATEAQGDSAVQRLNVKSPAKDSKGPSEYRATPVSGKSVEINHPANHSVRSQLLLSPSAACSFVTPHLMSSGHPSSALLPSLGLTPHAAFPLTSSPSAPSLTLPPPHSPSIQVLAPPVLSPCLSFTSFPSSPPPASPSSQNLCSSNQCHEVGAPPCPTPSRMQSRDSGGPVNQEKEESVKKHMLRPVQTLKAPAGSCLVDVCCLPRHSGGLCVAAAGKWAVCLWSQISASNWSLIHTWTFDEPIINVFSILDASELMCVTLGQLEIREVRVLSCSSLSPVLLHEGVVQAVVGVSNSRVVLSSHSATGSTLQVFKLSDSSSTPTSHHLAPPGVCIGALAPVDGLPDALVGTDECGHLFIWNLKTRQLLQRVVLRDDLSHTACLRGYSYCGVLFILLQHQLLSSLEEEEKAAKAKDQMFSQEEKEAEIKTPFFSLVAVNPLSGKSVLATSLYPPKTWSGRLCEVDVHGSSVVGLSQSGCVCLWELIGREEPRMVWAPEAEGWQLARWGGRDVLVTGHHNGDVTVHCYNRSSVRC